MKRESKIIAIGILRAVGVLAAIFILLLFIYEIQSVIVYVVIAMVVSLVGRPITNFLKDKLKFNESLAAVFTLCMLLLFFAGIFSLFAPIVVDQSHQISKINFDEVIHNINRLNVELSQFLGIDQVTIMQSFRNSEFIRNFDLSIIPLFLNGLISNLSSMLIGLFSVLFISFFFLKDSKLLLNSFILLSKRGDEIKFRHVFHKTKQMLSRYFIGLFLQLLIIFVLYSIILLSFQIPNGMAIALFCALLNVVPYIGPLVGGVVMLVLVVSGYITADFEAVILPKLIYVFIGYCIVQLIDNFINQPLIFGNSVKSHPLEIFLIIIIAGLLFGIMGMVVAVPVYTALKVIAQEFLSEYKIVQKLTENF